VECVENERRFAGAAQASDDDVFAEREIEIEALEVVLADTAEADGLRRNDRGWRRRGKFLCRRAGRGRNRDGGGLGGAFGHGANTDAQAAPEFNRALQMGRWRAMIADRTVSGSGAEMRTLNLQCLTSALTWTAVEALVAVVCAVRPESNGRVLANAGYEERRCSKSSRWAVAWRSGAKCAMA
jgi:hypothetical protein